MKNLQKLNGKKLNKKEQQNILGGGVICTGVVCPPGEYCARIGCIPVPDPDDDVDNGGWGK